MAIKRRILRIAGQAAPARPIAPKPAAYGPNPIVVGSCRLDINYANRILEQHAVARRKLSGAAKAIVAKVMRNESFYIIDGGGPHKLQLVSRDMNKYARDGFWSILVAREAVTHFVRFSSSTPLELRKIYEQDDRINSK